MTSITHWQSSSNMVRAVRVAALSLIAIFVVMLAGSSTAKAADCSSAKACSDAAAWQNAFADDYSKKAFFAGADAQNNFKAAADWHNKSVGAFLSGNGAAAQWYQAVANDYAHKAAASAKAADNYVAQAKIYRAAAQNSINRSEFLGILGEGSDLSIASNGRKCEHTIHHPSDPDAFGSGKPNSYGCEYWNDWLRVCDRHVDGNRVRVWWHGNLDRPGVDGPWATGWAPSQGCLDQGTAYGSGFVTEFRVCVENEGCSAWRRGSSG